MACGFVSYLGPFNKEFRELLLSREFAGSCIRLGIPLTKHLSVASFLVDDSEVGEWTLQVHASCIWRLVDFICSESLYLLEH